MTMTLGNGGHLRPPQQKLLHGCVAFRNVNSIGYSSDLEIKIKKGTFLTDAYKG